MDSLEQQFGRGGRFGVLLGALLILAAAAGAGYYLLRPDYQVLFAGLTPQDTAAMTGELDKQKIPYALADGDDGAMIMVDRPDVYKTRIKLMGKDIPLHGAVGFELFNNSDFGMTEFAQKVNYQRALQGELIRTILSITTVRDARVLLVLPEQGLLKQNVNKPKASVTLTMKPDQKLRPEQVTGIQRLVSSAVPGIGAEDVTIVDQSGVALTRAPGEGDAADNNTARLELKRDTETYLAKKAETVLDQLLGAGQALASVDVTLDMDRVQSNTDEVLGAPAKPGAAPTGVVVREHETKPELSEPMLVGHSTTAPAVASGPGNSQRDTEYAVSHRVEQVVSQPGSIRRLQVAIVVKKPLTLAQQEQLSKTVAASVGAAPDRGDTIVVQGLDAALSPIAAPAAVAAIPAEPAHSSVEPSPAASASWPLDSIARIVGVAAVGLVLLVLAALFLRRSATPVVPAVPVLTDAERRVALEQVRVWMRNGQAEPGRAGVVQGLAAPRSAGGAA